MNPPSILAIILNWRQPQVTLECVHKLQTIQHPNLRILVIDNGSGDESTILLQTALPENMVTILPENLGFAGGANVGLRRAIREHFQFALLLNNDAFPADGMLEKLIDEATEDIALLSPKIFYEAEPSRIWFAGGRQDPALLELRDTGKDQYDSPTWGTSHDVDYLLGTCLLVNLTAVQQAGLLDDQFFMYYEDLDWSIRLRQAGYRLRLVADAHLFHRVSFSTGGTDSPLYRYYLARSSLLFFRRHSKLGRPWAILVYRILSTIKMITRLTLQREMATAVAYLRGLRDGWHLASKKP